MEHVDKTITAPDLDGGGKLKPAKVPGSRVRELTEEEDKKDKKRKGNAVAKRVFVPILKINEEERTITGLVLQPEVTDAQGDIMSSDVIRGAAHRFLADFNKSTKLGLMHKDFKPRFELYESYITPSEMAIGDKVVKAGTWIMVVHVKDKAVWKQVKEGKLTGFSIGGKAKVTKTVAA